jgi:NAD-dependent dihydropyrimidine dehydrogenase PreA subunit
MLRENAMSILRSRRERFPWYPTIKCEDCLLDLECLNFCPAGVFDWDPATGKPIVARPFDCIPGCRTCAENCKGKNISLPGKREVAAALKRIRAEDRLTSPHVEGQVWGRPTPEKTRATANETKSTKPGNRSVLFLTAGKKKPKE